MTSGDRFKGLGVAQQWLTWYQSLLSEPIDTQTPWVPERMEYEFAVSAATPNGEIVLNSPEYVEGRLDWYDFALRPGASLGSPPTEARYQDIRQGLERLKQSFETLRPDTLVLIADDQALVRAGFKMTLEAEADLAVVGEAADGAAAVELARRLKPDVVLMDIRMPGLDGLAATRLIAEDDRLSGVRIVILTTFELDEYVFEAIRSGASGFLVKDTEPLELLRAVRAVAEGDALLSPGVTRRLIGAFATQTREPRPVPELDQLTEREREVMTLVAEGLTKPTAVARARRRLGAEIWIVLGLSLGQMLRLNALGSTAPASKGGPGWGKAKSVIMVYLQGGPSHLDLWDPKENVIAVTGAPAHDAEAQRPVALHAHVRARAAPQVGAGVGAPLRLRDRPAHAGPLEAARLPRVRGRGDEEGGDGHGREQCAPVPPRGRCRHAAGAGFATPRYPTPRTVWMDARPNGRSTLRRR